MKTLLTVDPGVHACGVAYFTDGKLNAATYLCASNKAPLTISAPYLAARISLWVGLAGRSRPSEVVIELPQVYRRTLSKGDPNDLINLAVVCGAIAAQFPNVRFVRPAEWGKQIPKAIKNTRALAMLSDEEKSRIEYPKAKSLSHNVLDAVAIGLWALKRKKKEN